MIQMHKNQIEWFKSKLGVSDYGIAWIAFIKGLIFGFLLNHFFITGSFSDKILPRGLISANNKIKVSAFVLESSEANKKLVRTIAIGIL